jgi:Zn-dependent protease
MQIAGMPAGEREPMTYPLTEPRRGLRLFGVGVNIDASWLMFALFIGWQLSDEFKNLGPAMALSVAVLIVIGLSVSILLHEMAHTLVGRAFGMQIDRITLFMFGGVAELKEEPRTAVSELFMALAGPALSVLLWLILAKLQMPLAQASAPPQVQLAVQELAQLNLYLAIFNMIPAYPMDGGRVLRSLIWLFSGRRGMATRFSGLLGQGFGALLILWGIYVALFYGDYFSGLWRIVLGAMLMRMAAAGRRAAVED